jgi:hypothetical protein
MVRALPKPPREVGAVARVNAISVLAPRMQEAAHEVVHRMDGEAVIFETLRTPARVAFLYGFGRQYDDGRGIVTKVRDPWTGWHPVGLAFDAVHRVLIHKAPRTWWNKLGGVMKKAGLRWGGDFNANDVLDDDRTVDLPHAQWGRCLVTPSPRTRQLVEQGGLIALWQAVGAA